MSEPVRVLVLDTVMDRGGAETMTMNYLRRMDRSKVQYDFLVNRDYKAAYEDEIAELGGKVYRMCPLYPQYFDKYKRQFRGFLKVHPEYRIIHSNLEERSYFALRIAKEMGVPVRIAHAHNRPVGFDLKSVVREYFRFRLPPYATHYFACGQEAGDWLFGVKNRSKVIQERNAVDTALYATTQQWLKRYARSSRLLKIVSSSVTWAVSSLRKITCSLWISLLQCIRCVRIAGYGS